MLEGFGGGKVYLNDPAKGRARSRCEELDSLVLGRRADVQAGPELQEGRPPAEHAALAAGAAGRLGPGADLRDALRAVAGHPRAWSCRRFTRIFIDDYLVGGQRVDGAAAADGDGGRRASCRWC